MKTYFLKLIYLRKMKTISSDWRIMQDWMALLRRIGWRYYAGLDRAITQDWMALLRRIGSRYYAGLDGAITQVINYC